MKLAGRIAGRVAVEPLDEERLTNIERRVVAGAVDAAIRGELRAPRWRLGGAVAAIAIAAAGAIGWALHTAPADAPLAAGGSEPAAVRVQTAGPSAPGRSVIDIGDARIESDPETAFEVTRPGGGVMIAMARGKLALEVAKRGDRPPLIVRAGDTDVVVIGTRFTVDYGDGSGAVAVQVSEGAVRVVHLQQETRVAAGQAWRTRGGLVAIADGRAGAEPAAPPGAPPSRGDPPAAAAAPPPELRDRTAAVTELLHDRRAAVPSAAGSAAPAPAPSRPAPRGATEPTIDPARPRRVVRDDPHVDRRAAIRAQRIEPALALGDLTAANAVTRYYDIAAHRSGDEASRAFYSIAVVKYGKLNSSSDALDTLDAYVRRFPGGKEYRAALWLRVRILCLERFDDRCRAAAYTYLHEAPDDPAAHVAELLTQSE